MNKLLTNKYMFNIKVDVSTMRVLNWITCAQCGELYHKTALKRKLTPCCKCHTDDCPDATIGDVGDYLEDVHNYLEDNAPHNTEEHFSEVIKGRLV